MTLSYFCLRYILLSSFILLGISGLILSAVSGFFIYEFKQHDYLNVNFVDYIDGPPAVLLAMGILTFILAIYFWYKIDHKYNQQQFVTFLIVFSMIFILKACSATWVLIIHEKINTMLSTSLKKTLTTPRINNEDLSSNIAKIKLICCGYNETTPDFEELTSWFCCNFGKLDNTTRIICQDVYGRECRHLALHTNRSILHYIFLLALCSIVFQSFITGTIIICGNFLKRGNARRIIQYAVQTPSAPPMECK